jgi:hypothetical protein
MDFDLLFCKLTKEPFNVQPSEFPLLTLHQLALILADPKDVAADNPEPVTPVLTPRDRFFRWAFYNCIPDHIADRLWAEGYVP